MEPTMEAVENAGVDAEVLDLRTLSPLDHEAVIASVEKTGRAVVVHEGPRTGGLGADVVARLNDDALMYLEAPVERVAGFDVPVPLLAMEDYYLPHPPRIEAAIERVLSF
jgi:pyruvate dehydrogenase E1 component beta subunit